MSFDDIVAKTVPGVRHPHRRHGASKWWWFVMGGDPGFVFSALFEAATVVGGAFGVDAAELCSSDLAA